jgi:hypothetical protein
MRVRILSGNQAGEIQEVGEVQGEHMLQTGFAERAPEPVAEPDPAPPEAEPGPEASLRTGRRGDVVDKEFGDYMDQSTPGATP